MLIQSSIGGMIITVLGSGTSFGVPAINCSCPVCTSNDPRDDRTRASIRIEKGDSSVVIDMSPDFRRQALREKIRSIDAILLTHCHADHVHGIDDIRPYTFKRMMPVYGNSDTVNEFRIRFSYIFRESQEGGGKPKIELREITEDSIGRGALIRVKDLELTAIPLKHGDLDILGYRTGRFAYLTDCSSIPESSYRLLDGVDYLIIDALRPRPHPTHFSVKQAMEASRRIGASNVWFTHICHDVMHSRLENELPQGFAPAYDGLRIEI